MKRKCLDLDVFKIPDPDGYLSAPDVKDVADEILDITEFFTSKFKLLVSYADHIVGVYEHSQGGHAWEAGYIDQPGYRERTRAFYRTYESDEAQYEAYDGMFAHYLLSMDRVNRAHTWASTDALLEEVQATSDGD